MGRRIRPMAVIAISAAVGIVSIGSRAMEPSGWNRSAYTAEVSRLQWHLARVEADLAAGQPANLSEAQCARRLRNIEVLRQYWRAGRFPHNHDFPGRHVPYFQDRHGRPSELAYLIAQSGRQDLVDRIATINNNGTVFEIANDRKLGPELRTWLQEAGLTIEEAALMQSFYGDF